jgi:hypothetical protein
MPATARYRTLTTLAQCVCQRMCQCACLCACLTWPLTCWGWGEEGHAIIALIAQHYLDPLVRERVDALLAGDTSALTADTSMASEASWADRYRDSDRDGARLRYESTRQWHYVDIELDRPDLVQACFGRTPLPSGTPASSGPAAACIVDKIEQFEAELRDVHTSPTERCVALQFVLHLVGDVHQPLHASDAHDQGANQEQVQASGLSPGNLHRYWDVDFVRALDPDPRAVADDLIAQIGPQQIRAWQSGTATDWASESYAVGKAVSFGRLPPAISTHHYELSASYVQVSVDAVQLQLKRAGLRLAYVLNRDLR